MSDKGVGQQTEQPTITNINVIWRSSYIMSTPISRLCYFKSPNINDLHLGWASHKFHRNIEDLLNLVIHFNGNIKTSFTLQECFYLIWTKWQRKFKIYTGQPGNLFLNFINVYKNLNLNKKFQIQNRKEYCNDRFSNFLPSIKYITSHSESTVHKCPVVTHTKKTI